MKIALTTHQLDAVGGISQFSLDLGSELAARGHEVAIVAFARGSGWERLTEAGISGVCLERGRNESVYQYTHRAAHVLERSGFDVIVNNIDERNLSGQRCLRFLPARMPRLAVLHSVRPHVFCVAAVNQRACDALVAVSPAVQAAAAARLPGCPTSVIPNGVRCPAADDLAQRSDWATPMRLLFVGRLVNRSKHIVLLPEILSACLNAGIRATLTIVGDGEDRQLLEAAIDAHGVRQWVELRGLQAPAAVYRAMQRHHVLLLPSIFEGLPLVLLEAQANGCVPVASRLPGSTDVALADGVTGLLAPCGDVDAFARQIGRLADYDRWRSFSRAAVDRAHAESTVTVMGGRYHRLLSELTAGADDLAQRRGRPDPLSTLFTWGDFLPPSLRTRLGRLRRKLSL